MNLLILQIIRKLYEFEPGAQSPLFQLTNHTNQLTFQQKGYLCVALGMYYYYGIRGDDQIRYQEPDLLRGKLYFSIASIQYGNPIGSRMLNIIRLNFQQSFQNNQHLQQFQLRTELKRQFSALSGDIDSKISLAKKIVANEQIDCAKKLQILLNISKQIIQYQFYDRTFYSKTFQLFEYHYFDKKYQHKIPSPQEIQMILNSQTISNKHLNNLQKLMLKYYMGIEDITPNKTKAFQIAQKLVQLYGQQSKISHKILGNRYFRGKDVKQNATKAMYHFNISYQYFKDVKCQMGLITYMGLGNYKHKNKTKGLNMMMNSSYCALYLWALKQNKNLNLNLTIDMLQKLLSESLTLSEYSVLQLSLYGKILHLSCKFLKDKNQKLIENTQIIGNKYRSLQRVFSQGKIAQSFLKNLDLKYIYQDSSYGNLLYFLDVQNYFPKTNYNLRQITQQDWVILNKFIKININMVANRYFRNNNKLVKQQYDYSFIINKTGYKKYNLMQCLFMNNSYCFYVFYKTYSPNNTNIMHKVAYQSSDLNYVLQTRYLLYLYYKNQGNLRRAKRYLYSALVNLQSSQYLIRLIALFQNPFQIVNLKIFNKFLILFITFVVIAMIAHRKRLKNLRNAQNHWQDEEQNNQQQRQQ